MLYGVKEHKLNKGTNMKQFNFIFTSSKQIIEVKEDNDHELIIEPSDATVELKNAAVDIPDWNLYMRSYMQDILRSGNSIVFNRTSSGKE